MSVKVNEKLINSIVDTVKDYQGGGIITPERVHNWINQFDDIYRETILSELDLILKKYYVSRDAAKTYLESLLEKEEIFGHDFENNYDKVRFLNIQLKGNSQKELLELFDELLVEKFGIYTEECGNSPDSDVYIYLDDCFFTGNRVHRDIEAWANEAKENSTLHLIFFGLYNGNFDYVYKQLQKILGSLSRFLCKRENDASYVGLDMEPLAGMSSCDWAMEKITPSQGKVAYHARPLHVKPFIESVPVLGNVQSTGEGFAPNFGPALSTSE